VAYRWKNKSSEVDKVVRQRVGLYLSPRKPGFERLFVCPNCSRHCRLQALLGRGIGCAKCFNICWGSQRESRIARLVRRTEETAAALGLNHWYEVPQGRPKGMRTDCYLALLYRRGRLMDQLRQHFMKRRRIVGNSKLWLNELRMALNH
jgi:hypothetical protein